MPFTFPHLKSNGQFEVLGLAFKKHRRGHETCYYTDEFRPSTFTRTQVARMKSSLLLNI